MKTNYLAACASAALLTIALPATANAAVTLCTSPGCVQPSSNVLFDTSMTGTTINATLNNSPSTIVSFTGDESLSASSNGQARVAGSDGDLTFLSFSLGGTQTFNEVEFNLNALADGTATLTFFGAGGTTLFTSDPLAISKNGQNFFGAFGGDFTSVQIATTAQLSDVRQVRLSTGTIASAVPEPATWASLLFGFGMTGFAMRRRRRTLLRQAA